MEAALRRVAQKNDFEMKEIEYSGIRGMDGIKKAEVTLGGKTLRLGVVSGLGNADSLLELIESGEERFDFVEVMACPYGCVAGAGQPFSHKADKARRSQGVYKADKTALIKRSDENPVVRELYEHGILKDRAHELLHTR